MKISMCFVIDSFFFFRFFLSLSLSPSFKFSALFAVIRLNSGSNSRGDALGWWVALVMSQIDEIEFYAILRNNHVFSAFHLVHLIRSIFQFVKSFQDQFRVGAAFCFRILFAPLIRVCGWIWTWREHDLNRNQSHNKWITWKFRNLNFPRRLVLSGWRLWMEGAKFNSYLLSLLRVEWWIYFEPFVTFLLV